MKQPIPSKSLTSARRRELLKEAGFTERDIPSEWRIPEGAVLDELTPEQSDAIELDRR